MEHIEKKGTTCTLQIDVLEPVMTLLTGKFVIDGQMYIPFFISRSVELEELLAGMGCHSHTVHFLEDFPEISIIFRHNQKSMNVVDYKGSNKNLRIKLYWRDLPQKKMRDRWETFINYVKCEHCINVIHCCVTCKSLRKQLKSTRLPNKDKYYDMIMIKKTKLAMI